MKPRPAFALSLAAPLLAALLLTGCTSGGAEPSPSSTAAAAPTPSLDTEAAAALVAAGLKSSSGSYKLHAAITYAGAQGVQLDVQSDPAAKKMLMTVVNGTSKIEARVLGSDFYLTGLPQLGKKWMKVDGSQVEGFSDMFGMSEQNLAMLGGIIELTVGPNGVFQGWIDPQKAMDKASSPQIKDALAKVVKASGAGARIPFTSKIADGYLVGLTTEYPAEVNNAVTHMKAEMTLSDFGKPVTVTAPPAKDLVQQ
ncbi:MAG: hypothetical protein HOU81_03585 [Hamadaea sp.]|uniref:hypothetical protein n=1 Tax=Hamadaea sp. TaxID=2024425 RepID=UPI0017C03204|nr:hypothetical protein [Hamadaea sp.]NUR69879.1 hypothetical protein [Hamadaea sp.]NUT22075.1 hypothetical protein [Hamadaea sp.]